MWHVEVICSDPACAEEAELWVEELDETDAVVCACGCCVVALRVSAHEPPLVRIAVPV